MEENNCNWHKWQKINLQIYKQLIQLNISKTSCPIKMGRRPKQIAKKSIKRFSTLLIIREM